MARQPAINSCFDMWKQQVEEGTQAWLRMLGRPRRPRPARDGPAGLLAAVHGPGHGRLVEGDDAGAAPSPDLMTQWKQFLDQWIAAWSRVLEQAMGTENFAQAHGQADGELPQRLGSGQEGGRAADRRLARRARPALAQRRSSRWPRRSSQLEEKIDGARGQARRGAPAARRGRVAADGARHDRDHDRRASRSATAPRSRVGPPTATSRASWTRWATTTRCTRIAAYAAGTPFKEPIAPGIWTAGLISAVIGTRLPGPGHHLSLAGPQVPPAGQAGRHDLGARRGHRGASREEPRPAPHRVHQSARRGRADR